MVTLVIVLLIALIGTIIKMKYSQWASNLFLALLWIALSFIAAILNNSALKEGEIDLLQYKTKYSYIYVIAMIGCIYLFPVMSGKGKKNKKKNKKKENNS